MVWTILESFGISGLSIIGLIVVARYIAPAEMGVAAMAQGIVQLLNIPVEFLFVDALIRHRQAEEIDYDTAHFVSVVMGIILTMLCWLMSGQVSTWLHVPEMASVLAWMGLSIAAMGFGAVIIARQRREMEFRALAIRSFAGRLAGVSVGIAVAVMGGGVWSLVAQQVLMVAFATFVLWIQCTERPSLRFSYPHFKDLATFGVRTIAVVGLNMSVQRIFTLFVGSALSTAAAGYLNLAFRVVDILRDIVTNAVAQLALPMFSRHSDDVGQIKKIFMAAVRFTSAVTFPLFAGLALCSADFIHLVFGPQWTEAAPYISLLSFLTLVHFSRLYSNSMVTARGYPHLPLVPDAAALVWVVLGMIIFGTHSLTLAALVWALRLCVSLPIDMYNIRRVVHIGYWEQVQGVVVPLFSVTAMAIAILGIHIVLPGSILPLIRLVVDAAVGGIAYGATLWALDKQRITDLLHFALEGLRQRKAHS